MSVFHWSIYNLIADLRFFYAINMVCRFFLRLKTKEVIPRKGPYIMSLGQLVKN